MAKALTRDEGDVIVSAARVCYRPNKMLRFGIGYGRELVYGPISKKFCVVDSFVGEFLAQWEGAKTLDDAVKSLLAISAFSNYTYTSKVQDIDHLGMNVPAWLQKLFNYVNRQRLEYSTARPSKIRTTLNELIEADLLVSDAYLLEKSREVNDPECIAPKITTLGIPTCNRPERLKSCLSSFLLNVREYERDLEVVIMDDSTTKSDTVKVREVLKAINRDFGTPIYYGGFEEKNEFVTVLERVGIPLDVIRFALFGESACGCCTGANRNGFLLHSAGEMLLTVDDDTACWVVEHPQISRGLEFLTDHNQMCFWVFANRQETLKFLPPTKLNVLGAYEKLLGKTLNQLINEFSMDDNIELSQLCRHMLESMQDGRGRVVVVFTGVLGNSGMYSPMPLLGQIEPATRGRILNSMQSCDLALRSGEILRLVQRWTVCHGPPFVGAFMALDNRTLLPPFMPVARNAEGVFGCALQKSFPHAFFGHLPWSMLHTGAQGRSYVCDLYDSAAHLRISDLVSLCIDAHDFYMEIEDGVTALKKLGQFLTEVSSMKPADFEEQLRIWTWQMLNKEVRFWEGLLEHFRCEPEFWARAVRTMIERRCEAALKREFVIPHDLTHGRTLRDAADFSRQLIGRYGKLLSWWPDIVAAVVDLRRRQGNRLGSRL